MSNDPGANLPVRSKDAVITVGREWWRSANVYQIYPMSFCDSNGDGIGDVPGITSKLDYLQDLGVDIIWLSPIYASPNKDMGYDISDYRALDPRYGTMEDMDRLLDAMKKRGMKLMMDLVVNHSSDMHAWFIESRSSKSNPRRDWYIWRPAKYNDKGERAPPNNWTSSWGGSAWEWDDTTEEYYLHLYLPGQPDLNWENPDVRRAVYDLMLWWLEKGVSGFRMDVINLISKPDGLPDVPPEIGGTDGCLMCSNGARVSEYLQEMNREVLSKYDIITVGETPWTHDPAVLARYVVPSARQLNMVFTFHHVDVDGSGGQALDPIPFQLVEFKSIINKWQTYMHAHGGWNSVFIENHDQARSVSRFGNDSDQWRSLSAKMLAMLHISQSGTVYVYQGEEIAMANVPKSWGIEEYKDVATQQYWDSVLHDRKKSNPNPDMTDILSAIQHKARDNARTPIQWDASSPSAGFSSSPQTWMRVNEDYKAWNVASQVENPDSVHGFWKKVLAFRKSHPVLIYGSFRLISPENEQVFAILRRLEDVIVVIVLNFVNVPVSFDFSETDEQIGAFERISGTKLQLSNYNRELGSELPRTLNLEPYEGRIYVGSAREID